MITDRDYLRAERDYLRPPSERDPRCPCCDEVYDPDTGEILGVLAAEHLGVPVGTVVCRDCDAVAREDLARPARRIALTQEVMS